MTGGTQYHYNLALRSDSQTHCHLVHEHQFIALTTVTTGFQWRPSGSMNALKDLIFGGEGQDITHNMRQRVY
jgi:hypothetical protein